MLCKCILSIFRSYDTQVCTALIQDYTTKSTKVMYRHKYSPFVNTVNMITYFGVCGFDVCKLSVITQQ